MLEVIRLLSSQTQQFKSQVSLSTTAPGVPENLPVTFEVKKPQ